MAMLLCAPLLATAVEPMDDSALAQVAGRDGMSFNLSDFSLKGSATLRYHTGDGSGSFSFGDLTASRSDNPDGFADPYRFDIVKGSAGRADIMRLSMPENAAGHEAWQASFVLGVQADGRDVNVGTVELKDLVYYGGGFEWSTPQVDQGLAFGIGLRSSIGSLALRQGESSMILSGVHIGARGADGAPAGPWRLADVTNQPGLFQARTDAEGQASLHVGIGWAGPEGAPQGTLQIENIAFRSPTGNVDLGASRIGSIQLNYLDVRFRP